MANRVWFKKQTGLKYLKYTVTFCSHSVLVICSSQLKCSKMYQLFPTNYILSLQPISAMVLALAVMSAGAASIDNPFDTTESDMSPNINPILG